MFRIVTIPYYILVIGIAFSPYSAVAACKAAQQTKGIVALSLYGRRLLLEGQAQLAGTEQVVAASMDGGYAQLGYGQTVGTGRVAFVA